MTDKLVVWEWGKVQDACLLHDHSEIEDRWDLTKGVPRAATFPGDVTYNMHPDFPHNTLLVDNVRNRDGRIIVSTRLKEFLEARKLVKVEYLPVTILDHRGRPATREKHFIVHPIDPVDCFDVQASGARFSLIDKQRIQDLERIVVDEQKLDPARELFKMKLYYDAVLLKRELADALTQAGFTGFRWKDVSKFRG